MICKHILLIAFSKKPEFNFWQTIRWLKVLLPSLIILFNIVCTQWSAYKYCYLTLIILFSKAHSFADHHHYHHVVPQARISLTLSRHFSLSFITSGRSSGLHPVSSHSCWMYVWAGCPAFIRPYMGVHRSTSLMSSSLLLQQCPACLVRLTWIVFVMGGRWPYSCCLVRCCCQDLINIARKKCTTWTRTKWLEKKLDGNYTKKSFVDNLFQILLYITNNSIKRQSIIYLELIDQTVLF